LLEPSVSAKPQLMSAIDQLNSRFGRGAVKISTQGAHREWQMRQERKSPNYTTEWDEIPEI
jgi:DNA polymerase V